MTDTSTRPARATTTRWDRHSPLQTFAELSLGLSFTTTVAFGGYTAATGQLAVVSQVAGVLFLVTLTCVVVSWFRAVERDEHPGRDDHRASTTAGDTAPLTTMATAAPVPLTTAAIAAVDAEYRR